MYSIGIAEGNFRVPEELKRGVAENAEREVETQKIEHDAAGVGCQR